MGALQPALDVQLSHSIRFTRLDSVHSCSPLYLSARITAGSVRISKTGILDAFFLHYQRQGEATGKSFLDWLRDDYDEAALKRDFHANGLASFINDWVLAHE